MTRCVTPALAPVVSLTQSRRAASSAALRRVCALQHLAPNAADNPTDDDVDWIAVLQVARDGARLPLRGADRREAIRQMAGRIDADLIAWRLLMPRRAVDEAMSQLQYA